jgi:hypothetical protein
LIENGTIVLDRLEIFLSKLGQLEPIVINKRLEAIAESKGRAPRPVDIGTCHDDLWGLGDDSNDNTEEPLTEPWTKEDVEKALNEAYVASTDPLMESIKVCDDYSFLDKGNNDVEYSNPIIETS